MLSLLYGTGMRLMKGLRLRLKDIDLRASVVTVTEAKGKKDRVTILPESLVSPLKRQIHYVEKEYRKAPDAGYAGVEMRCPESNFNLEACELFRGNKPGLVDEQRQS